MNDNIDTSAETHIDLVVIAKSLWANRKKVIRWGVIGLLAGVVIAFSIPKEYTSQVKIAPESQSKQLSGSAGALASMMGVGTSAQSDGINEKLYPQIITSTPFLMEFANTEVDYKGQLMPLSDYLLKHRKRAWWSYIFGLPSAAIDWISSIGSDNIDSATIENSPAIRYAFVGLMNQGISTDLDAKLGVITIKSTFQDPVIAKMVTDSLIVELQQYMSDYRTAKTRNILETTSKLMDEAKVRYYQADEAYARSLDRNQHLISKSAEVTIDRLLNERDLAYQVYFQLAQQVESNRIKLQEQMPVVTVIEPATTPIGASAPSKMLIILGWAFFAGFCSMLAIIVRSLLNKQ